MIKANELRIGNYIYSFDNISIVTSKTIEAIESEYMSGSPYEPIPLTEEWLLKFGFDKAAVCWRIIYNELGNVITINQVKGKFYLNYLDREIKYVHQLQNLHFALNNEELKLK